MDNQDKKKQNIYIKQQGKPKQGHKISSDTKSKNNGESNPRLGTIEASTLTSTPYTSRWFF